MVELELKEHEEWSQNSTQTSNNGCRQDRSHSSNVQSEVRQRDSTLGKVGPEDPMHELSSKVQDVFAKVQKLMTKDDGQFYRLELPSMTTDGSIGVAERDSAVSTIKSMQRFYNFGSDTLASAVDYLDRFLSKVKVKTRYLSCVAAACFYLATKMHEESEHHPSASDLSNLNRRIWKASDLKRMEKIILDKLDWNLFPNITSLAYLHVIYDLLKVVSSDIDKKFFTMIVQRTEMFINYTRCAAYRACTLAVSTIHQCLKESGLSSVVLNYVLLHVQAMCKISDSELLDCQCAISKQLELFNLLPATRPLCLPLPKLTPRPNLVIRPSSYGSTDLPTIQEVPWSCELMEQTSDEEDVPYSCGKLVNYVPCLVQPDISVSQRLCFINDKCYCGTIGAYYPTCNISL